MPTEKPPYYTVALREFIAGMPQAQLDALASECATSSGHLRNCANGSRGVSEKLALQLERATRRKLTRKMLRSDWSDIWPEIAKNKK